MNTEKTKIDVENFERKGLFNYFMQFQQPRYCIVTKVDVTDICNHSRQSGHLNAYMVYAITKACNAVENFKYFAEDEKTIYKYKFLHAGNTFFMSNNQIRYGVLDINQSLEDFLKSYDQMKDEIYKMGKSKFCDRAENYVGLSCIKWFKFSGMQEISRNRFHSGPEITWDKIEFEGDHAFVNMAICVNHAFVDGFHIHPFLEALEREIGKFKKGIE